MENNNNATTTNGTESKAVNQYELAKQDGINPNEVKQPVYLPSYGGKKVPVSIVISQRYTKPETLAAQIEKEVYAVDAAGNIKYETKPIDGVMLDGKQAFETVPVVTGKALKTVRYKTGGILLVEWSKVIAFECSDANDLRKKIGEGFEQFKADVEAGKKVGARSKPYQLTVKIAGLVISTMSLQEGGVKLSSVFEKKIFKQDLFARHFCRPLWQQLGQVKDLATGKALSVSAEIVSALK